MTTQDEFENKAIEMGFSTSEAGVFAEGAMYAINDNIVQKAAAWDDVCVALTRAYPEWIDLKPSGKECALEAIRLLAERANSNEDSTRLDYLENNWHVCGFARQTKGWYLYYSKTLVDNLRLAIDRTIEYLAENRSK